MSHLSLQKRFSIAVIWLVCAAAYFGPAANEQKRDEQKHQEQIIQRFVTVLAFEQKQTEATEWDISVTSVDSCSPT